MLNLANGQLATSAGTILAASAPEKVVNITLHNTSASVAQTILLTICCEGGTGRRVFRGVLAANEYAIIANVPVNPADVIQASTTTASVVDYIITQSAGGALSIQSFDATGALKQVNTGVSGNQAISGNTTVGGTLGVTGASTLTGAVAAGGALSVAGASTLTGATTQTGALTLSTNLNLTPGATTAAAGADLAGAGALPAGTAAFYPTTAADDTKGVKVHVNDKVSGRMLHIGNGVSDKILKVYGPSGATINGAAADAAFSSASGKGVWMYCLDATANTWLAG